jgi:hypothetical protein
MAQENREEKKRAGQDVKTSENHKMKTLADTLIYIPTATIDRSEFPWIIDFMEIALQSMTNVEICLRLSRFCPQF